MEGKQPKKTSKKQPTKTAKKTVTSATAKNKTVKSQTTKSQTVKRPTKSDMKIAKRSHGNHLLRAVIILLVIAFVLTGGFAVWYFAYYSNPDKVAYDAIQHILKSDSLVLEGSGTVILSGDAAEGSPVSKVVMTMNSNGKNLPAANATQVFVYLNQDMVPYDQPLVVTARTIISRDGVLYFQINGIADSIDSLLDEMNEEIDESILAIFDTIEGEWWQVSLVDLLQEYSGMSEREIGAYQDVYNCALDVVRRDNSEDIINTLKEHRFISIEPAKDLEANDANEHIAIAGGYQAYTVNFDKTELAGFINQIPHTAAATEFVACYNRAIEGTDGDKLDVTDLDEIDADDIELPENVRVSAEISRTSHRLRSIRTFYDEDGISVNSTMIVNYNAAQVDTPESYRPVSELIDELSAIVMELFSVAF